MIKPAFARVTSELQRALTEAKLAYQFVPNSYTCSCLQGCSATEAALAVLSDILEDALEEENKETQT